MTKIYSFLIVAIVFLSNVMAQNIPSYVPTNGLVGWWPFNGNANDESGNGNHGTVNGATLTTDRNGNINSAYSFDGINNYISVDNNIISFDFGDNQSFSISLWVKTSYSCSNTNYCGGILSKMGVNTSNIGYQIGYNSTNKWNLEYNTNSVVQSPIHYYNNNIVDNQWHMITTCIDKVNNKIYFYTDGVLTNTVSQNWFYKKTTNQNPLYFGRLRGGDYYYNGFIDDISIHNRVLTQQEITALYTSTPPCTNPTATITPEGNTTFCQGGFVNLNASTGINYTYQWYNNGQIINGATTSTYQANTTGNYTVKVMDGTCSTTSTITTVFVNPNPTASITPQGNTTFCQGGFVNLVANGGTSYQWNTGSNNSTISANQSGTYSVNVFNSFGCQATASQVVTVNTNPTVTFNGLNEYTLKNQSFVQLTGTPAGGTFIGEGVQGSTFTPANVSLGKKTISYNYTSPQGCSGSSTRYTFVVDSIGNVCSVTKYDTVTVKNNVYDTIKITKHDTITITNNVTKYDTILKLKFKLTTGINANQMTSMTLYPNPTTDVLNVSISDAKALEGYRYRILDAVGKEVYNELVKNPTTEIPLKSLGAAGMYLFEVIDQQNKTIQSNKIVLE
jgi:hypothetical protein